MKIMIATVMIATVETGLQLQQQGSGNTGNKVVNLQSQSHGTKLCILYVLVLHHLPGASGAPEPYDIHFTTPASKMSPMTCASSIVNMKAFILVLQKVLLSIPSAKVTLMLRHYCLAPKLSTSMLVTQRLYMSSA